MGRDPCYNLVCTIHAYWFGNGDCTLYHNLLLQLNPLSACTSLKLLLHAVDNLHASLVIQEIY